MALQSCLVAVAALLVCGATARPQKIAVFESINFINESVALPPPSVTVPRFNMKTMGACSSGTAFAPPCSDAFPVITLEADSVVQIIVPGSPMILPPLANCGWEFQGPSDGQLYISCQTASFFFGQYFLVWEKDTVVGVHNQQNVDIKYQFSGSSGRVGVRTLSKSFYDAISCEVAFTAGDGATVTTPGAAKIVSELPSIVERTGAPGTVAVYGAAAAPTTVTEHSEFRDWLKHFKKSRYTRSRTTTAPTTTSAPTTTPISGTTVFVDPT